MQQKQGQYSNNKVGVDGGGQVRPSSPSRKATIGARREHALGTIVLAITIVFLTTLVTFVDPTLIHFLKHTPLRSLRKSVTIGSTLPASKIGGVTLFNLSAHRGDRIKRSSTVVVLSLSCRRGGVGLASVTHSDFI